MLSSALWRRARVGRAPGPRLRWRWIAKPGYPPPVVSRVLGPLISQPHHTPLSAGLLGMRAAPQVSFVAPACIRPAIPPLLVPACIRPAIAAYSDQLTHVQCRSISKQLADSHAHAVMSAAFHLAMPGACVKRSAKAFVIGIAGRAKVRSGCAPSSIPGLI